MFDQELRAKSNQCWHFAVWSDELGIDVTIRIIKSNRLSLAPAQPKNRRQDLLCGETGLKANYADTWKGLS
jgi:hypothetical protein